MSNKYNPWKVLPKKKESELMTYLNPILETMNSNKMYMENVEIYRNPENKLKNKQIKENSNEEHFNHTGRVSKKNDMNEWLMVHNYDLVFLMTYKDADKDNQQIILKSIQTQIEPKILKKIKDCSFVPVIKYFDLLKTSNLIVEEYIADGHRPTDYNNFEFMKKHQKLYTNILADIFSELHFKGIIYNEEIPHHLMLSNTSTNAKLIDFGNSSFGTKPGQYHGEIIRIIAHMQKHKIRKINIDNFIDLYRTNIEEQDDDINQYLLSDNDQLKKEARLFLKNKSKGLRI